MILLCHIAYTRGSSEWTYLHLQDATQIVVGHAEPLRLCLGSCHRVGRSCILIGCHTCLRPVIATSSLHEVAQERAMQGNLTTPAFEHAWLPDFCLPGPPQ